MSSFHHTSQWVEKPQVQTNCVPCKPHGPSKFTHRPRSLCHIAPAKCPAMGWQRCFNKGAHVLHQGNRSGCSGPFCQEELRHLCAP